MGKVGRPLKYDTPEEAAEANRKLQEGRDKKKIEIRNSNPTLKAEAMKFQVEANARYNAKKTPEQKERDRENNRIAKQNQRAKEKIIKKQLLPLLNAILELKSRETNTICLKWQKRMFKEMQMKIACEQAKEN